MIICSCHGITESQYRKALRQGRSMGDPKITARDQLELCSASCQAGRGCGSCVPTLLALAEAELARKKAPRELPNREAILSIVG